MRFLSHDILSISIYSAVRVKFSKAPPCGKGEVDSIISSGSAWWSWDYLQQKGKSVLHLLPRDKARRSYPSNAIS